MAKNTKVVKKRVVKIEAVGKAFIKAFRNYVLEKSFLNLSIASIVFSLEPKDVNLK